MIEQLVDVLIDAGLPPIAAVRAAYVLDAGGSVHDAEAVALAAMTASAGDLEVILAEFRRAQSRSAA
jgi:hypothetical protein